MAVNGVVLEVWLVSKVRFAETKVCTDNGGPRTRLSTGSSALSSYFCHVVWRGRRLASFVRLTTMESLGTFQTSTKLPLHTNAAMEALRLAKLLLHTNIAVEELRSAKFLLLRCSFIESDWRTWDERKSQN